MAKTLAQRDEEVIWHPYTQHKDKKPPIPVIRGKGSLLYDEQGNHYIDAISSWWVTLHGHGHPYIAEKIYEQAQKLEQVIFTGFTHEPAVTLAERLLPLLPGRFSKLFYSDNGSTAVEVALKMAIQYWKNRFGDDATKAPMGRHKILSFKHAYHGDTFGAMSVSGRSLFTAAFRDHLFETLSIDTPTHGNINEILSTIHLHGDQIACFIYEPLLQGAGGMLMTEAGLMDRLLEAARQHGIVCIADEVLTGFGRTGRLFAGEWLNHKADIVCLSKGLTGGAMAMGATAAAEPIFEAFLSDDKTKTFFHGHSFTANPLACSAALASLDLLLAPDCRHRIDAITARHQALAQKLRPIPVVRNIRTLGTVLAFEVSKGKDGYENAIGGSISLEALDHGIYLRPLGNTVYLLPPYCLTEVEYETVETFLQKIIPKQ